MSVSKETLDKIHELLALDLKRRLDEGETKVTKDGDVVKVDASPATLNVIRQFLKDNHIEGIPADGSALASLATSLPFDEREGDSPLH